MRRFALPVNPCDSGTVAYFEYGETIAYGRATDGQDIGSRNEGRPRSAQSSRICSQGTTYHFRSVAFNAFGTTFGEDQTFTTLLLGVGWPTATKVTGGFATSPRHVVDTEGNAYVAGLFSGSATFKTTLGSSNASPEAFVAKLGRGADWLWESKVNSSTNGTIVIRAIAVDGARNVYVAGQFSGAATFGTNVLNAAGQTDAFVAKLNSQGNAWLWARSAGATNSDSANALAVTPVGTVFLAGHFRGAVNFGTNNLSSANGSRDIFVAKLDTAGTGCGRAARAARTRMTPHWRWCSTAPRTRSSRELSKAPTPTSRSPRSARPAERTTQTCSSHGLALTGNG